MSVQGIGKLKKAVMDHHKSTAKGLRVGLYRGGLFLQRESQKVVPVDTGALKGSAATRIEGQGFDSAVVVSYGMDYAVYVHENLEARHKPGKIAKYLSIPIQKHKNKITEIVVKALKENRA